MLEISIFFENVRYVRSLNRSARSLYLYRLSFSTFSVSCARDFHIFVKYQLSFNITHTYTQYLQNNIIGKMEGLNKLKDLQYLNLALNNIARIEGLRQCEFLSKLDLTVNFIDLDTFEDSISELREYNKHLKELYMIGNPAMDWDGAADFIIASLPFLVTLDGEKITKGRQIQAAQRLGTLRDELRRRARVVHEKKKHAIKEKDDNEEDCCSHTPEARLKMYREVTKEKEEKEKREEKMRPRVRDDDKEHADALSKEKSYLEETKSGDIRQCNQGGYVFSFDEDENNIYFEVSVPKNLSTALIDANVFPTYISVVIKQKILRIKTPAEVNSDASVAQRSRATGSLKITAPKVRKGTMIGLVSRDDDGVDYSVEKKKKKNNKKKTTRMKIADEIMEAASRSRNKNKKSTTTSFRNIVKKKEGGCVLFSERRCESKVGGGEEDGPPPLE